MPKIDFNKVDDVQDFSPLPDGKYSCTIVGVEEGSTQYGDEMWKVRFMVDHGPHRGRCIFDNLVFSKAAMKRAKLVCSRLGLDVSGELDLKPEMIQGRRCYISVETEQYTDHEGRPKRRNVVPFAGYGRADGAETPAGGVDAEDVEDDSEEDLPF